MPKVTLFEIITQDDYNYGYNSNIIDVPYGSELIEVDDNEFQLLKTYIEKYQGNRNVKYALAIEENESTRKIIDFMIEKTKEEEIKKEIKLKKLEEENEKKRLKKIANDKKKFERLKKQFEKE
jgi:hypothetical protein